jgi:hypothetical protein
MKRRSCGGWRPGESRPRVRVGSAATMRLAWRLETRIPLAGRLVRDMVRIRRATWLVKAVTRLRRAGRPVRSVAKIPLAGSPSTLICWPRMGRSILDRTDARCSLPTALFKCRWARQPLASRLIYPRRRRSANHSAHNINRRCPRHRSHRRRCARRCPRHASSRRLYARRQSPRHGIHKRRCAHRDPRHSTCRCRRQTARTTARHNSQPCPRHGSHSRAVQPPPAGLTNLMMPLCSGMVRAARRCPQPASHRRCPLPANNKGAVRAPLARLTVPVPPLRLTANLMTVLCSAMARGRLARAQTALRLHRKCLLRRGVRAKHPK